MAAIALVIDASGPVRGAWPGHAENTTTRLVRLVESIHKPTLISTVVVHGRSSPVVPSLRVFAAKAFHDALADVQAALREPYAAASAQASGSSSLIEGLVCGIEILSASEAPVKLLLLVAASDLPSLNDDAEPTFELPWGCDDDLLDASNLSDILQQRNIHLNLVCMRHLPRLEAMQQRLAQLSGSQPLASTLNLPSPEHCVLIAGIVIPRAARPPPSQADSPAGSSLAPPRPLEQLSLGELQAWRDQYLRNMVELRATIKRQLDANKITLEKYKQVSEGMEKKVAEQMGRIDAWIAQRQYEAQGGQGPPPSDPRQQQQAALGLGIPRSQPTMQPAAPRPLWTGVVGYEGRDGGGRIQIAATLTAMHTQSFAAFVETKLPQQLIIRHIVNFDKVTLGAHIRSVGASVAKLDTIDAAQLERTNPVFGASNAANMQALCERLAPATALAIIPVEPAGSGQCVVLLANGGNLFAVGFLGPSVVPPPALLEAIARS